MVIYSKHKEHKKSIHHTLKINLPQPRPKHIVLCSRFTGRPPSTRIADGALISQSQQRRKAPYPLVSRFTHSRTDVLLSLATSEAAPIKCDGRESAGLPTLSVKESVGLPALSI